MTTLQNLVAATAACLVMAIFQAPAAAAENAKITNADDGWAAFRKCSAIREDGARHACFDDVSRAAGYLAGDAPSPGTELASHAPPPQTAKDFGLRAPPPSAEDKSRNNQVEATVATVTQGHDGKFVFTMADGGVWRQVEGEWITVPKQGETVTIEKTSLGGFFCKPVKGPAFRCKRTR